MRDCALYSHLARFCSAIQEINKPVLQFDFACLHTLRALRALEEATAFEFVHVAYQGEKVLQGKGRFPFLSDGLDAGPRCKAALQLHYRKNGRQ